MSISTISNFILCLALVLFLVSGCAPFPQSQPYKISGSFQDLKDDQLAQCLGSTSELTKEEMLNLCWSEWTK